MRIASLPCLALLLCLIAAASTIRAQSIGIGDGFTCAVTPSGGVKCMGNNDFGQLGNGKPGSHRNPNPVDVAGLTSGVAAVAVGYEHACALQLSGQVMCWGSNSYGQLGDGATSAAENLPVKSILPPGVIATALATGEYHTCAVTTEADGTTGHVRCWGENEHGQLGDGTVTSRHTPTLINLAQGFKASSLSAGSFHTCALTTTRYVQCWGANYYGQLGDGTTSEKHSPMTTVIFAGGSTVVGALLVSGHSHSCALTTTGVQCWGSNTSGELGLGDVDPHLVPAVVSGLVGQSIAGLSIGADSTCAITSGDVRCWGIGSHGEIGNGTLGAPFATPQHVPGSSGFGTLAIGGGFDTMCILAGSIGEILRCWGDNAFGQFGNGQPAQRYEPTLVSPLMGSAKVNAIAAGGAHTCTLTPSGVMQCWGDNTFGQLGNGTNESLEATPVYTANGAALGVALATGGHHSCAIDTAGNLKCWGSNTYGQVGTGITGSYDSPTTVNLYNSAKVFGQNLALGSNHSCAITGLGVQCWGRNYEGQVGNGSGSDEHTPVLISLILSEQAKSISAGSYHTCAATTIGSVQCWGANGYGQVGAPINGNNQTVPYRFFLASGAEAAVVSTGNTVSCAITTAHDVQCWGSTTFGVSGSPSPIPINLPSVKGVASKALALAIGSSHACVLTTINQVLCWGSNYYGQLGVGNTLEYTSIPQRVPLPGLAVAITAGDSHTCVILQTGNAPLCWGDNEFGQLGNGEHGVYPLADDGPWANLDVVFADSLDAHP